MSNILNNLTDLFKSDSFTAKSIVNDITLVSDPVSKLSVIDTDTCRNYVVALIKDFESKAYIYESKYTIDGLKDPAAITIRPANNGFDILLKILLSGTTDIIDATIQYDPSIAILF